MKALKFAIIFFLAQPLLTEGQSLGRDEEYQQRLQRLNQRYEDFFVHERKQRRWEQQRLSGREKAKERRKAEKQAYERARRAFAAQPDPEDNREKLKKLWEAKERLEARQRERQREAFIERRKAIEKIEESARHIPLEKEVGLE